MMTKFERAKGYGAVTEVYKTKLCLIFQDETYTPAEFSAARVADASHVYMMGRRPKSNDTKESYLTNLVEAAKLAQDTLMKASGRNSADRPIVEICPAADAPLSYPVGLLPGDKPLPSVLIIRSGQKKSALGTGDSPRARFMRATNWQLAVAKGELKDPAGQVLQPHDYQGILDAIAAKLDAAAKAQEELSKRQAERQGHAWRISPGGWVMPWG